MKPEQIAAFLVQTPLFKTLDRAEIERLVPYFEPLEAKAGVVLLNEGASLGSLFLLCEGVMMVSKRVRGDLETVITRLRAPAHLGEIDLIDSRTATASVTAESPCVLVRIDQKRLRALMESDIRLFGKLAWALLEDLAGKLRATNQKLQETVIWGLDASGHDPGGG